MPAPNTWGAGKHLPSTTPKGFLCLAWGETSHGSGSVLGGSCCPRPMWPRGRQPPGTAPLLPALSQCQILCECTWRQLRPCRVTRMAGADGMCQIPRELRHLGGGPVLQPEPVGMRPGVKPALARKPRAAWSVMGAVGGGILGYGCGSTMSSRTSRQQFGSSFCAVLARTMKAIPQCG